jgi:hypothetical protein
MNEDVGPDPVWGVGLFFLGLLIMAVGGAATWHWVFNIGEGILLLGAVYFLGTVAITALKQDPVDVREAVRGLLRRGGGEASDDDDEKA